MGQLLPTILVDKTSGMPTLLWVSATISTGTCILCWLFARPGATYSSLPQYGREESIEKDSTRGDGSQTYIILGHTADEGTETATNE